MKRVLISGIIIGLFITIGAIATILYATGYRFDFRGNGTGAIKFVEGTGLLVATSKPDGARVSINGHLTTATNNTISLAPGSYEVGIDKDGYLSWHKTIIIKKSLVSEANALLLPAAPKLEAVTTIGVNSVIMDQSNSLIAYTVASASASENGIYVLNMNSGPFAFVGASGNQIINDLLDNFSAATLSFSPDGKQILAQLPGAYYLLSTSGTNTSPQDVTDTLDQVNAAWQQEQNIADKKVNDSLPRKLRPVAGRLFKNMLASPDNNEIVYTASASATIPLVITPPIPSLNSVADHREIKQDNIYVYDVKEDKNYEIQDVGSLKKGEVANKYLWHADSRHLVFTENGKVNIEEYDGGNLRTLFNGPFVDSLVFPWPDGSSVAIISRLSDSVPYNIYRISLQ